ncbi:hypothetical protein [Desulfitobacterium dehalogenans]|nr:hypothetical protein [Desulfitobacterium dehalogenans]
MGNFLSIYSFTAFIYLLVYQSKRNGSIFIDESLLIVLQTTFFLAYWGAAWFYLSQISFTKLKNIFSSSTVYGKDIPWNEMTEISKIEKILITNMPLYLSLFQILLINLQINFKFEVGFQFDLVIELVGIVLAWVSVRYLQKKAFAKLL